MSEKKEVVISCGKVVIKALKFGDEGNAVRKALVEASISGYQKIDVVTKRECLLLESIESCPFPKTLEHLRNLSRLDGLKIWDAYVQLNEVHEGESKSSDLPSLTKDTQTELSEESPDK